MKSSLILTLLFISSSVLANDSTRQRILRILDEELNEVSRLSRQYKEENPAILFRKSELYLEKGRVTKEGENEKFIGLAADIRAKSKKSSYFTRSRQYFQKAKTQSLYLLKNFPDYKRSADVYYILGFNEKEFGSYGKAFDYLQKAEKYSKPGSKSRVRAENALAEIYYNKKNYSKAIQYYEKNLSKQNDKWWTKDAYNLSWSYFRKRQYSKAINLMKKVEAKSSESRYIDMRSQVKKDIGFFYAESGKISEGVKHYQQYNQDYVLELIKISKFLEDSGKYAQAMTVLNEALKISKKPVNKAKIYIARMQLFDKYEKINYHLKDSIALYKLTKTHKLTPEQYKIYKYQVERQVGKLQKKVGDKSYQKSQKVINLKVKQVASYLTLLKGLDPSKEKESYFYVAETYYQAGNFDKAMNSYLKSYELAAKDKNSQIRKRSLDGMVAALGVSKARFPTQGKYYEKVYGLYLKEDARSAKAQRIYQSLFKINLDKNNDKEMRRILNTYSKYYPRDVAAQEKMVNSLILFYSKRNDSKSLEQMMALVNNGTYKVSVKSKKDLRGVSEKFEVKKIEEDLKRGNYSNAIAGYQKVYSNLSGSKLARSNAAYNLMALYSKENNAQQTYSWAAKSIGLLSTQEFFKYQKNYLSVTNFLVERFQFESSADISHRSFGKLCGSQTQLKDIFFINAIKMYLVSHKLSKVNELKRHMKSCKMKADTSKALDLELLSYYESRSDYSGLERTVLELERNSSYYPILLKPAYKLYSYYQANRMNHKLGTWLKRINRYYVGSQTKKSSIPKEGLDAYAWSKLGGLNSELSRFKSTRLRFPEKTFNTILERKIKALQTLTDSAAKIQKIGSGLGIVASYEKVIDGYSHLINEIATFTPPGKKPEYVKSFKNSMKDITTPLSGKVAELRAEARRSISKNEILTKYNSANENFTHNYFSTMRFFDAERRGR